MIIENKRLNPETIEKSVKTLMDVVEMGFNELIRAPTERNRQILVKRLERLGSYLHYVERNRITIQNFLYASEYEKYLRDYLGK